MSAFAISPSLIGILLAAFGVILSASLFTIDERQKGLLFQFGEIVGEPYGPGLHLKVPFVNSIRRFDVRVQTLDTEPERFLTAEKKNLMVDAFVRWQPANLERYFTAVRGDPTSANLRLDQLLKDGLRGEFSRRTVQDVVSGERSQIMALITDTMRREADLLGINVVDVRIKRIELPTEVSSSVFQRMRAERARVARDFRSRGAEAAERIQAEADRQRTVLLAEAFRDSETMRGEGDANAARIYAQAYSADVDFFQFYRSLSAYRTSFEESDGSLMVLQPDSDFFRYFRNAAPGGVPSFPSLRTPMPAAPVADTPAVEAPAVVAPAPEKAPAVVAPAPEKAPVVAAPAPEKAPAATEVAPSAPPPTEPTTNP